MTHPQEDYAFPVPSPFFIEITSERELFDRILSEISELPLFSGDRTSLFAWRQDEYPHLHCPSPCLPGLPACFYRFLLRYQHRLCEDWVQVRQYDTLTSSWFSLVTIPFCYQDRYLGGVGIACWQAEKLLSAVEITLVKDRIEPWLPQLYHHDLERCFAKLQSQQQWLLSLYRQLGSAIAPAHLLSLSLDRIRDFWKFHAVHLWKIDSELDSSLCQWSSPPDLALTAEDRQRLSSLLTQTDPDRQITFFCDLPRQPLTPLPAFVTHWRGVVPIEVAGRLWGGLAFCRHDYCRQSPPYISDSLNAISAYLNCAIQKFQTQQSLDLLTLQNRQLENNCQNKSDFLAHINHELRTPLTGILGFAKMLRQEIYGSLNEKQKQYVQGIAVSGEHLLALVNDFLDLSKIEANREELYWETVVVEDICLAAISIVQSRAKEQGLKLGLEIEEGIDFCTVDQRRVKQILLNLLSNAIKFTEFGSVYLKVRLQEGGLQFCVIDTGIGIKDSDLQLLFQPFHQLDHPLSRKHKGTGLGLALSRKLAQLHGGNLTVTSTVGKGSCFTLHLPRHPFKEDNRGSKPV